MATAKIVAALQNANTSGKPILLIVNYDSGHWSEEKYVRYHDLANLYDSHFSRPNTKIFNPYK